MLDSSKDETKNQCKQTSLVLVAALAIACLVVTLLPSGGKSASDDLPSFLQAKVDNSEPCTITFYTDANYGGSSQTLSGTNPCLSSFVTNCNPSVPNDHVSSIKTNCASITLFADANLKGKSKDLTCGDYPWLPNAGFSNDVLSSVRVNQNARSCADTSLTTCEITLYQHGSFAGTAYTVAGDKKCVETFLPRCQPSIPNDVISSLKTNCKSITLYEHANLQGAKKTLGPGDYPWLPSVGFANDVLSSIKVNDAQPC